MNPRAEFTKSAPVHSAHATSVGLIRLVDDFNWTSAPIGTLHIVSTAPVLHMSWADMLASYAPISRVVVGHTTDEAGMESLADFISQRFPDVAIHRARCGATLGTYFGPGAFGLALVQTTV